MRLCKSRGSLALWLLVPALVATSAMVGIHRYRARPFFASSFYPISPGGLLLSWDIARPIGLHGDRVVWYDRREHVLLVVQVSASRNVEWVIDGSQPISNQVRLRRQDDRFIRTFEWRRDCLMFVDREGTPTYCSISPQEFRDAFANPGKVQAALQDLVARHPRDAASRNGESEIATEPDS